MVHSVATVLPAAMLSVIWHHREKLSQEQRAALDASRPEVTLSCYYALRGLSTVQDRIKSAGENYIIGGTEKVKCDPVGSALDWSRNVERALADYC